MKIITNNRPRAIVYGHELAETEAAEFDYMTPEDLACADFVRYKGQTYDIGEFMRAPEDLAAAGWDGATADSFFSGVLIRLDPAGDYAVLGRYYS